MTLLPLHPGGFSIGLALALLSEPRPPVPLFPQYFAVRDHERTPSSDAPEMLIQRCKRKDLEDGRRKIDSTLNRVDVSHGSKCCVLYRDKCYAQ